MRFDTTINTPESYDSFGNTNQSHGHMFTVDKDIVVTDIYMFRNTISNTATVSARIYDENNVRIAYANDISLPKTLASTWVKYTLVTPVTLLKGKNYKMMFYFNTVNLIAIQSDLEPSDFPIIIPSADNKIEMKILNGYYIASDGDTGVQSSFNTTRRMSFKLDFHYFEDINKVLFYHNSSYFYFNPLSNSWMTIGSSVDSDDYINYGLNLEEIINIDLNYLSDKTISIWSDKVDSESIEVKVKTEPYTLLEKWGNKQIEIIEYTNSPIQETSSVTLEIEPYSVYDYISEKPTMVVYTDSTDDITVTTITEPFDLYDEFGDEVEVLYYTDDNSVSEPNLTLEANWSPIDELNGDFEVVTWTDEDSNTAQRVSNLTAIPKPQFVKLVNPKLLYGYLNEVIAVDISDSYRDEVRYLFTDNEAKKWYVWDKTLAQFKEVNASTHELITANGMKHTDLQALSNANWNTWDKGYMNIGVFLKDNPRDTITSIVESISYKDYLPRNSSTIENTSLYILNTTAKIDISLNGNTLKGVLSDNDLTRVQYRVFLNGANYYPSDGQFTKLGDSPQNIEIIIGSKDVKIDDWNTLKVEFQDFFGTTDYWTTQFIGTYSGLMFKDVYGQYYSSEIGEILQYLDFGIIIAGQTTIENEVILKNQYGYDVENVHLYANTSKFPEGMIVEFSETQTPFLPQPELRLSGVLENNEEINFFIRLKTELGATPDANGSFDIIVRADRA